MATLDNNNNNKRNLKQFPGQLSFSQMHLKF